MQDLSWNAGKKFMGNVDGFLKSLLNFDKDNIPGKFSCLFYPASSAACSLLKNWESQMLRPRTLPENACSPSCIAQVWPRDFIALLPYCCTSEKCVDKVEKDYISSSGFNPDNIRTKSSAAAGLCAWVINICKYFRIYQVGG